MSRESEREKTAKDDEEDCAHSWEILFFLFSLQISSVDLYAHPYVFCLVFSFFFLQREKVLLLLRKDSIQIPLVPFSPFAVSSFSSLALPVSIGSRAVSASGPESACEGVLGFDVLAGPPHWSLLLRGRALDNQTYVIGCSPSALSEEESSRKEQGSGEYPCYGHSMIVSPFGEVIAQLEGEPGVLLATLDSKKVDLFRKQVPISLQKRFDEVYTAVQEVSPSASSSASSSPSPSH